MPNIASGERMRGSELIRRAIEDTVRDSSLVGSLTVLVHMGVACKGRFNLTTEPLD